VEFPTGVTASAQAPRRYDPPHILWYFGAVTAALAATATIASVSASHRGAWQFIVGIALMALFAGLAVALLRAGRLVPGGVLVAAAVLLVPAVGQAFERLIGVWPDLVLDPLALVQDFQGAFFAIGVATILISIGAFALVRFPFVFAPAAIATLITTQLLVPAFVENQSIDDHATTILATGVGLFLVALVLDSVGRAADAFWWHAAGLFGLAVGLTWYAFVQQESWAWITILVLAGALIVASAPFRRSTWTTFGVVGVFGAMLHYDTQWFGSWKSPALMIVVSLGLIALGIVLQLNTQLWASRLHRPTAPAPVPPAPPTPPVQVEAEEPPPSEDPTVEEQSADEPPIQPS
jgi:hypothetical protein